MSPSLAVLGSVLKQMYPQKSVAGVIYGSTVRLAGQPDRILSQLVPTLGTRMMGYTFKAKEGWRCSGNVQPGMMLQTLQGNVALVTGIAGDEVSIMIDGQISVESISELGMVKLCGEL